MLLIYIPNVKGLNFMKKIASVLLTVVLTFAMATTAFATAITFDQSTIPCIDFLDFSNDTMYWATPDENGKLPTYNPTADNASGKQYPTDAVLSNEYDTYLERLEYSLTNDNEVLHLVSKSSSPSAIAFKLGEMRHEIKIGTEAAGCAEYVKIRIRNTSSSTKMAFGWTRSGLSGWTRSVSTIDIDPNMTGWYTLTISMNSLNIDTNTSYDGSYWGAAIKDFIIFPFGYSAYGSTFEGYEGATMDIDYIVIGSYDYVTNYKSDLEIKEESATSFTPVTLPEKTTYYIGETLDLTGLDAKIEYKDGSVEHVDTASAIYDFDNPAEKTTVTLKYGDHSFSYDVSVIGVNDIEIETMPEETTYTKANVLLNGFTPTGLTVKVNYADGTTQIKNLGQFKLEDTNFSDAGDYIITVNFYGTKTKFNIKLIDVVKFTIVPHEDLKVYYGTEVSASNFDITCIYNDGSESTLEDSLLSSYFTMSADTKIAGGNATLLAQIRNDALDINLSDTFEVKVETPTAIKVTSAPSNKNVHVDSTFDKSKVGVSYVYDDVDENGKNITAEIDSDDPDLIVNYDFSVPGITTQLKIKAANGLTTTYDQIKVREATFDAEPFVREGGTVSLLSAKFPTFWLVFIIVAAIIVVLAGIFCLLKFVFKVNFKRRKRASLDDIF